jgi:hypothetical protein
VGKEGVFYVVFRKQGLELALVQLFCEGKEQWFAQPEVGVEQVKFPDQGTLFPRRFFNVLIEKEGLFVFCCFPLRHR